MGAIRSRLALVIRPLSWIPATAHQPPADSASENRGSWLSQEQQCHRRSVLAHSRPAGNRRVETDGDASSLEDRHRAFYIVPLMFAYDAADFGEVVRGHADRFFGLFASMHERADASSIRKALNLFHVPMADCRARGPYWPAEPCKANYWWCCSCVGRDFPVHRALKRQLGATVLFQESR